MLYTTFVQFISAVGADNIALILLCAAFVLPGHSAYKFSAHGMLTHKRRAVHFDVRSHSVWRPHFKKDGYYGSRSDKTLWE